MSPRPPFPFSADIKEILRFRPQEGQIKLGEERILLFSQTAVSLLRSLMHAQLGPTMTRMLLSQFGYQQGRGDYETLQGMFKWDSDEQLLAAGPLMHAWSGIVQVEPLHMEVDRASGHFHFRGVWHNSYEAEIYKKNFGRSSEPVCYSLSGYGSGWCTAFFGKPLLEIEHRCVARGDEVCEWEIKPWDAWGPEADPWKKSLLATSSSLYQDLLASHRTISELNQNLEKEVERRSAENKKLLRMICHDLVVPLKAMEKSVHTLVGPLREVNEVQAEATLLTCLQAMQEMLGQVREADALESGKKAPPVRAVSLHDALDTIRIMFKVPLENKNLHLQVANRLTVADSLGVPPITFISNILSNVMSNAIKFSPRDGTIFIEAQVEGDFVKISVRDEGIGIPARLRPHIFSQQMPTSRPGTAGESGTGFGLPIVKSYIDGIGGRIEIQSRSREEDPNHHGTTVSLYIPRAPAGTSKDGL